MKHLKRFATGLAIAAIFAAIVGVVFCFDWFVHHWQRTFVTLGSVYVLYGIGYLARLINFNYGDEA